MLTQTKVARVAHEVNRAYCQSLGDLSQPKWEEAPEWQRSSAIKCVEFHILNPKAGPEEAHKSWMEQKIKEGWTYGSIECHIKKKHPYLIPYDELPKEQHVEYCIFRAAVHALLF